MGRKVPIRDRKHAKNKKIFESIVIKKAAEFAVKKAVYEVWVVCGDYFFCNTSEEVLAKCSQIRQNQLSKSSMSKFSSFNTHVTGTKMYLRKSMQPALAVLITALLLAAPASADIFTYPDQMGSNVVFSDITEVTGTTFSLFSGLNAYNDTLDFDAFNFRNTSLSGTPSLDGRLSFSVNAKPGQFVQSVKIQEVGSYTTINNGIAQVFLGGTATGSFGSPQLASNTQTFIGSPGIQSGLWDATITFDNFSSHATGMSSEVFIDLDNRLTAFGATLSDYAFIDKKLVLVTVTTAIPEPSSLAFLMGCAGVLATRRRRRA